MCWQRKEATGSQLHVLTGETSLSEQSGLTQSREATLLHSEEAQGGDGTDRLLDVLRGIVHAADHS